MSPNYLSPQEAQALISLSTNEHALEAVRKVLLAPVYNQGVVTAEDKAEPTRNFALALAFRPDVSNEKIGEDVRACAIAINLIQSAIREIEALKPKPDLTGKAGNPAR